MEAATPSERYLSRLCRRSFLRLWSWPNVYRDQSWSGGSEGKEVCDLLVVFDNHIFIFSDKHCEFPDTGNLVTDWSRWFRAAVETSARQIWGAERWIKTHPDRLFLDPICSEPFPFPLPSPEKAVFHRVVVAHGSAARCRAQLGGSGSLMLASDVVGAGFPFTVGHLSTDKGYVHVFDDFTLDTVLHTVDTAADLAQYLQRKEQFVVSGKLVSAAGEEELLAYYLRHVDDEEKHCFDFPYSATFVSIDEGFWDSYCKHPDRLAQIQADKVSYIWDGLIDEFTKHVLAGTQYFKTATTIAEHEVGLRLMAREGRTRRRMLGRSLLAIMQRADTEGRSARVVKPSIQGDPYYIFLALQHPEGKPYEEYRIVRRNLLEAYCFVTRLKFPDATGVVGIATNPWGSPTGSEDLVYLDCAVWTDEDTAEAARLQSGLGLLGEVRQFESVEPEYPLSRDQDMKKGRNRNRVCPCGSGKKFKRCHGSNAKAL
jgi:hypothetical protein